MNEVEVPSRHRVLLAGRYENSQSISASEFGKDITDIPLKEACFIYRRSRPEKEKIKLDILT